MKYQMLNRSLYLEVSHYLMNISVVLAGSVNNYGFHMRPLQEYHIDRHSVAPPVRFDDCFGPLEPEMFDIEHGFGPEQYLNHEMTILVYLALKYLLAAQKLPATQKMNQCELMGERQFFDFRFFDA